MKHPSSVESERARLSEAAAERGLTPSQRDELRNWMRALEKSAVDEKRAAEIAQLYQQLMRIMVARDGNSDRPPQFALIESSLEPLESAHIAQGASTKRSIWENCFAIVCQIMEMTYMPHSITQGIYRTCSLAVIQNRLFTLRPARAAQLIADIMVKGCFRTFDRSQIMMTPRMLRLDEHACAKLTDGYRNVASMIFQRTAANVHWQRAPYGPTGEHVVRGNLLYYHSPHCTPTRTGEMLVDVSHSPPKIMRDHGNHLIDSPHLYLEQIVDVYQQIDDGHAPKLLILTASFGKPYICSEGISTKLESVGELTGALQRVLNEEAFPIFVHVGEHIAVVRNYDPQTNTVAFDNNWTCGHDHLGEEWGRPKLPVDQLFKEMNTVSA